MLGAVGGSSLPSRKELFFIELFVVALGYLICNIQLLEEDNCNGNTVAIYIIDNIYLVLIFLLAPFLYI